MGREKLYWLGWAKILSLSPSSLRKIYNHFNSPEEAWSACFFEFQKLGIKDDIISEFLKNRDTIELEKISEDLEKRAISLVTIDDLEYPKILKEIYDPPLVLFCRGNINLLNSPSLAVVGTRKISSYGKLITPRLVGELCRAGLTVVSGLALGVDALVHQSALETGGKTIAVLGSGIDEHSIYPYNNRRLANEIIKNQGLIISEYYPGTGPLKHHFPVRNRIISGLTLGTMVIEAAEKSGALITAHSALSQNREVFAVPGNILSSASKGTNNLIKMGAKPVTSVNDIIEELNLKKTLEFEESKKILPPTPDEKIILNFLENEPTHIDIIIKRSRLSPPKVNATLTFLEMKGLVKNVGGMNYIRIK